MMNYEKLVGLPKIELHCHLDGSLRATTVLEIGSALGLLNETANLEGVSSQLQAPLECDSLDTYLKRFELPIAIMQTRDVLERVTYELFEDAYKDGVRYLEVRYAPHLHTRKGLDLSAVIGAVIDGMRRAEGDYPIKGNVILSHLRHHTKEAMFDLVDAGLPFLNKGVVAVDLCGSELSGYAHGFLEPVAYAREKGYRITMHAGETGYGENVVDAILLLGAERIGHGVAIANHPQAYTLVKDQHIVIESCPTSNIQTKAVASAACHPIHDFYKDALAIMVNTDNRTVSQTTMTHEYALLVDTFNWNQNDFLQIYMNSVDACFADDAIKNWLRDQWNAHCNN